MRLSCCYGILVYAAIVQIGCMLLFPVVKGKLMLEPMDPSLCSSDNVTFVCKGNNLLINDTVSLYIDNKAVNSLSGYKDEFKLDYTLISVTVSDHIPAVACIMGEERQISMLNIQTTTDFNGVLSPMDPHVCVAQNITITCTLLDNPEPNHSILFFQRTYLDEDYVAVSDSNVDVVNASVSKYTFNVTSAKNMIVRCYYSEPTGGVKPTMSLSLGEVSTIFPAYESNPEVFDFHCISYNFVDSLNCSWKYRGYYEVQPDVAFEWKMAMSSVWTHCPQLDAKNNYCYWASIINGDFSMKNINIRLNLTYTTCGNRQKNKHYKYNMDTETIVKPNPVGGLTSEAVNSTCIKINWNTAESRPEFPITQNLTLTDKWSSYDAVFDSGPEADYRALHNYTFCGLQEYTVYTISAVIKYKNGGFWSDARYTTSKTLSAVPGSTPAVVMGGYSWNPLECQNEPRRTICFMLQPIDAKDENGDMKGLKVTFRSNSSQKSTRLSEDSLYGCEDLLLCNESYHISIVPYNDAGDADNASVIDVEKWTKGIIQPNLKVEIANGTKDVDNHTVYLQWSHAHVDNVIGYYVFRCTKEQGGCKQNDGVMTWEFYPASTHAVSMTIESPETLSYGVSLVTNRGSSGLQWETCAYTKGVCPTKSVQNVDVLAGSEDNTLVVTWDKIPCQSGEPFINSYVITYCQVDTGLCEDKKLSGKLGRDVLTGLEEVEYVVKVQGVSDEDCLGPFSDLMRGTPEHRSLKPEEIGGIITACLIVLILAGVGMFCCISKSNVKYKLWKKKIAGVKLPDLNQNHTLPADAPQDDIDDQKTQSIIDRQDSNDSGIPETPKADDFKKPEFIVHPDGYCKAVTAEQPMVQNKDMINYNYDNDCKVFHNTSPVPHPVDMSNDVSKTKETVTKDSGISNDDYNKAILETSGSDHNKCNVMNVSWKDSTIDVDVDYDDHSKIELKTIPKPIDHFSCSDFNNDFCTEEDELSIPDYVRSHNSGNQNSPPVSDQYVQSSVQCEDTIPATDQVADSYIELPVQYGGDLSNTDQTPNSYVKSPVQYGGDLSNTNQTPNSYVKSPVQYGGDLSNTNQTPNSYVKSPVQYGGDLSNTNQTPNSYVKSPVQYGGDLSNSDQTPNSYVKSPVQYGGDLSNTDQTPNSYVKSPVQYGGDLSNSDPVPDSYIKSPVQYGGDLSNSDPVPDSYVKSPVQYGGDLSNSDPVPDSYVKSPVKYGGDLSNSDPVPDSYVKSPVQYGDGLSNSDPVPDSYVKSPVQYGGDFSNSDPLPDSYVKSPVQYGGDLSNSDQRLNSYVKSPVQYGGDLSNSDPVPDSYVKSPVQYGGDFSNSDQTLNSYVKSPVQYGGDLSNTDQTPNSYVKSPVQYGGDLSNTDQTPNSYVKSPVQYGGGLSNSDPVPDSCVKSPVQYGGDLSNSDPVPDSYVKSPVQYGDDLSNSDPVPDSYVKSPVQYGDDLSNSDPVPDSYIKSPVQYGGDLSNSDPVPGSYVKSQALFGDNRSPLSAENALNDINDLPVLNRIPVPSSGFSNNDDTSVAITKHDTSPTECKTPHSDGGNNDSSHFASLVIHTPTTKVTPADYIALDQIEMLKKAENNSSLSDHEPALVTEDVPVTDDNVPDLTQAAQQGYVQFNTIVDGKHTAPDARESHISKIMSPSDQFGVTDQSEQVEGFVDDNTDASVLDSLHQQTSDHAAGNQKSSSKSPCRNMSDASDSSTDSVGVTRMIFEGSKKKHHNSDSGLSSLEC